MNNGYNTEFLTDVWENSDEFVTDFKACPFKDALKEDSCHKLYYLLYERYGNTPIANEDINQFKYKVYGIIFSFGSTWEKRLEIQSKVRSLSDEELMSGSKQINNHANNPGTPPYTASEETLNYIDAQTISTAKRGKLEAYNLQWSMLEDVTTEFIEKFSKCFKMFVAREYPILYPDIE